MRIKRRNFLPGSLITVSLAAIAAIGATKGQNMSAQVTPDPTPTDSSNDPSSSTTQRQVFVAQLAPVNGSGVTGTARVVVEKNTAGIFLQADGLDPSLPHEQHIHLGTKCADSNADSNQDGFVDAAEASTVTGDPILQLSLNSGTSGSNGVFPVPAPDGALNYIQSISLALTGVPSTTPSTTPTVAPSPTSLPSPSSIEAPVALEGHVIEIHGVGTSMSLPATVQSVEGKPANITLPVACGVLTRLNE